MKGDARATKEASPTPTSMRHRMRVQNPSARPQPAVESAQMPRPTAISRKAFTCLLASAKMGEDTSRPTCMLLHFQTLTQFESGARAASALCNNRSCIERNNFGQHLGAAW